MITGTSGSVRLRFRASAWLCLFACMQVPLHIHFFLPTLMGFGGVLASSAKKVPHWTEQV